MTQYYTDYSGYSVGSPPSDWTIEWSETSNLWSVESSTTGAGGQVLETGSANGYESISWDSKGGGDIEVVCGLRQVSGFNPSRGRIIVRGSGTATSKNGYYAYYDGTLQLRKYVNDSHTGIASVSLSIDETSYFWLRLRANGMDLKAKIWQDGSGEPSQWQATGVDSSLSNGFTGIFQAFGDTWEYSEFGVGTAGDSAPTSPVSGGAPAAPSNLSASLN